MSHDKDINKHYPPPNKVVLPLVYSIALTQLANFNTSTQAQLEHLKGLHSYYHCSEKHQRQLPVDPDGVV